MWTAAINELLFLLQKTCTKNLNNDRIISTLQFTTKSTLKIPAHSAA